MSGLGVHFAISQHEAAQIRSIEDQRERLQFVREAIERPYFAFGPELRAESDRSWDAMHRSLSDGRLDWNGGTYPLNHVVLGGERLYAGDDYIVSLKTTEQVRDIAEALAGIRELAFRYRYFAIDAQSYPVPISDEDFRYTWEWFQGVRKLYAYAAQAGRCVLFTAEP
ncbi:MAG: YfbM family protein [Nevskia sp.]|nr:YfbM family protein [Nevskia sp.]